MRAKFFILASCIALQACTHSGEVYDSRKHKKEDISQEKTAAAVLGTAAVIALAIASANSGGGGGYYTPSHDYSFAWDYQRGNGQWVCRGRQTGRYHFPYRCNGMPVHDYTWPG